MAKSLHSLGYLAQMFQTRPDRIRAVAAAAGVRPALVINGVDHYDGCAVDKFKRELERTEYAGMGHSNATQQQINRRLIS